MAATAETLFEQRMREATDRFSTQRTVAAFIKANRGKGRFGEGGTEDEHLRPAFPLTQMIAKNIAKTLFEMRKADRGAVFHIKMTVDGKVESLGQLGDDALTHFGTVANGFILAERYEGDLDRACWETLVRILDLMVESFRMEGNMRFIFMHLESVREVLELYEFRLTPQQMTARTLVRYAFHQFEQGFRPGFCDPEAPVACFHNLIAAALLFNPGTERDAVLRGVRQFMSAPDAKMTLPRSQGWWDAYREPIQKMDEAARDMPRMDPARRRLVEVEFIVETFLSDWRRESEAVFCRQKLVEADVRRSLDTLEKKLESVAEAVGMTKEQLSQVSDVSRRIARRIEVLRDAMRRGVLSHGMMVGMLGHRCAAPFR